MTGRGKLSDTELSKKLGHYQEMSRVWILVGHPVFAPVVSGIIRRFGDPARGIDETIFIVVGKAVVADGIIVAQKVTVHTVVVPDIEGEYSSS